MRRVLVSLCVLAAVSAVAAAPVGATFRAPCRPGTRAPVCTFWNAKVTFVADGDTIRADIEGDGRHAEKTIRFIGINAMELRRYSKYPSRRAGDCHGVEATALVDRYVARSHRRIRLAAQHASSRTGPRLRRSVWVKTGGAWRDVARIELQQGQALWLPNGDEYAHNREYEQLAERAIAAGRNLYDPDACGAGPEQDLPISVTVNWDANGNDEADLDDEWVDVRNGGARALRLGGWWLRDSWLRFGRSHAPGYVFPDSTTIPPGGVLRLHVGCGADTADDLHWCQPAAAFENVTPAPKYMGDGAYLFDPDGDLRASTIYPCTVACVDPLAGEVRLSVHPRSPESIGITNVSGAPIDLGDHTVKLHLNGRPDMFVFGYPFRPGSVVGPGETMQILPQGSPSSDTAIVRHLGFDAYALSDGGGVVSLRTMTDVVTACAAWGSAGC
jgi:endonuclease YncB( thermonuclease family)